MAQKLHNTVAISLQKEERIAEYSRRLHNAKPERKMVDHNHRIAVAALNLADLVEMDIVESEVREDLTPEQVLGQYNATLGE